MDGSKTYFERIPVETVKKIAQKFPAEQEVEDGEESTKTPDGAGKPPQRA